MLVAILEFSQVWVGTCRDCRESLPGDPGLPSLHFNSERHALKGKSKGSHMKRGFHHFQTHPLLSMGSVLHLCPFLPAPSRARQELKTQLGPLSRAPWA